MTIPDEDIRFEATPQPRGGQHVGIVRFDVRLTHLPTGITITVGTERSQLKNRKLALSMLEWGLAEAFPQ